MTWLLLLFGFGAFVFGFFLAALLAAAKWADDNTWAG